jgi:hypothetical protein
VSSSNGLTRPGQTSTQRHQHQTGVNKSAQINGLNSPDQTSDQRLRLLNGVSKLSRNDLDRLLPSGQCRLQDASNRALFLNSLNKSNLFLNGLSRFDPSSAQRHLLRNEINRSSRSVLGRRLRNGRFLRLDASSRTFRQANNPSQSLRGLSRLGQSVHRPLFRQSECCLKQAEKCQRSSLSMSNQACMNNRA